MGEGKKVMQKEKKQIAKNKLYVIFILSCADFDLTEDQLIALNAEFSLMEYYELMDAVAGAESDGFIVRKQTISGIKLTETELGRSTSEIFGRELSYTVRSRIRNYMEENQRQLALESRLYSEYMQIGEDRFRVIMRIMDENLPLFEISAIVKSKEEADRYSAGWRRNAIEIYGQVIASLLKGGNQHS